MQNNNHILLPSGGYARLKSFQLARLIYDITVRFVELYIPPESRTCDQMVQAARSGVQNIAEGSVDAATSTKIEIKLYNVARGSLEELNLDYQDYLRQKQASQWDKSHFFAREFIQRRVNCASDFRNFIQWAQENDPSVEKSLLVANGAILLINTATYFLRRQIERKSRDFTEQGGFSEQMYRKRKNNR